MAIPTIATISPDNVPTGGRTLIEITGTNFKVPTLPPALLEPSPDPIPTVEVLFNTTPGTEVAVISATRLFILVPKSPISVNAANNYGEGSVDVTINNLDDNGDPIVGETVTLADGLAYSRAQLATQSDFARLIRDLIHEFRLQTIPNVSISTHTEFDPNTGDLLNITGLAQLPGIALIGPDLVENRFYSQNKPQVSLSSTPGEYLKRRVGYTVDMEFTIVGVSDLKMEILNLMAAVNSYFERNKYIEFQRDASDSSLGTVQYEIDLTADGDLKTIETPNDSNIRAFSGRFVIRGFDMQDLTGFDTDQIIGKTASTDDEGVRLTSVQLGTSYKIGSSPKGSGGI
jgi:hypothetical protein